MTDQHNHDRVPIDESLDELEERTPAEAVSPLSNGAKGGMLPLVGGGVLLLSALRSMLNGRLRSIPVGIAGAGLLRYGLRKRRSSDDESGAFEPSTEGIEGGTDDKAASDEAVTATGRPDAVDIDETGDVPDDADLGDEEGSGSRVEFVADDEPDVPEEPRSKPGLDADVEDPRRNADDETDINLSDAAMAEEASEAAGPSPKQAQPTQTDATEPEETPDEDASEMKVDPDEDSDAASRSDDESDTDDADEGAS
ncbi:hypothetical protein [Halopiger djelfimassiliensis]|uniref:hypothetical protein n=1 Tax=Halopiger djelfimassiliensis TaxID=1293047 RepID=UPI000677AF53|nr:hypothetical protein [Halopiger djelfimassiliensis]